MGQTMTLPIGTELRSERYTYRIERVLGHGSFGITYQASISLAGQLGSLSAFTTVAIKEFFIEEYNGRNGNDVTLTSSNLFRDYKRKFIHEANALKRLNHPHIVKVLDLFEAYNTAYFAMEYCSGGSLKNYIIDNQRLPESKALTFFSQIADALMCMHNNRMLHLDIKPSNIVLRENGEAVLIDFGLSKQFDEKGYPESSTTIGCGTPGYAPIEQTNYHPDEKQIPVTMDIYALGATLYKMLTGTPPPLATEIFEEGFPTQYLQNIGIGTVTTDCIRKAMSTAKKERYQSVCEFVNALQQQDTQSINTENKKTPQKEYNKDYNKARKLYQNKHYSNAFGLFRKCATEGHIEAQYYTGYCYERGIGTKPSLDKACIWYSNAVLNGHNEAKKRLETLQKKIKETNKRQEESKWVRLLRYIATRFMALIGILSILAGIFLLLYILINSIR